MRKTHYRIVLDVLVYQDDDTNFADEDIEITIDDGGTYDIQDVLIESIEVTDSR